MNTHTVKAFDNDIGELRGLISQMGGLAEDAIDKALRAIPVDAVKSTEVATGQSSAAVEANPAPGK